MILSILLFACVTLSLSRNPACATEDCEETELLTLSRKPLKRRGHHGQVRYLVFPVQGDAQNILKKPHKVTVAASGGGTRAMSGTIGQLRALKDMKLLDEVNLFVAISGATWATAVYLFADKRYSSEDLLGATTFGKLKDLTLQAISTPNGELIKTANEPQFIIYWSVFDLVTPQVLLKKTFRL